MLKFLRYNSRHCLWFPRGYKGWIMPRLNPMESCNQGANNKRTVYLYEPRWFYKLRQRIFCFAGSAMCGGGKYPSTWRRGPDGFRTCSSCWSLHFEDFIEICRRTINDQRYAIEPSSKNYKIYVTQPGVRNASEGAIKYYTDHSPEKIGLTHTAIYEQAVRISNYRYEQRMQQMRSKN